MKPMLSFFTFACALAICCSAQSQLDELLNKAENAVQTNNTSTSDNTSQSSNLAGMSLSNSKIADGLKEALTKGTGTAVATTGRPDGYFKNEAIKILLPSYLQSIGKGMRMIGMGAQVDDLELSMNRAAEKAAPAAKPIFIDAIFQMTFADARKILSGGDTAATDYFKKVTTPDLTKAFTPIVHDSMENVGLIKQFNQFLDSSPAGSLIGNESFNLDSYVTGKALDGLFYELAQEEKKIRTDPAAQTTALLKQVFGKL
jgi:Protein of unknown function (DUF4197)